MVAASMIDGGGVTLQFCGAPRRLRFSWGALSELRAKFGPAFQDRVNEAMVSLDFDVIALALSLGSGGAVTPEQIKDDPPAIVPALNSLQAAFVAVYHGPDGPPEQEKRPLAWVRRKLRTILSAMLSKLG